MIVRADDDHLWLVTQPDHAGLSADVMAAWQADGLPERPTRAAALFATAHHDDGWTPEDAAPRVDPTTGWPCDFIHAPASLRQGVWRRAVPALALTSTYAAALVAQHALSIYRGEAADPSWRGFFQEMEHARDEWYSTAPHEDEARAHLDPPHPARLAFLQDYAVVALGDLLSLTFCNGWTTPREREGYAVWFEADEVVVTPDPFGGRDVPIEVRARRIARRAYRSDAELGEAIAGAAEARLSGRARGRS